MHIILATTISTLISFPQEDMIALAKPIKNHGSHGAPHAFVDLAVLRTCARCGRRAKSAIFLGNSYPTVEIAFVGAGVWGVLLVVHEGRDDAMRIGIHEVVQIPLRLVVRILQIIGRLSSSETVRQK